MLHATLTLHRTSVSTSALWIHLTLLIGVLDCVFAVSFLLASLDVGFSSCSRFCADDCLRYEPSWLYQLIEFFELCLWMLYSTSSFEYR